MHKLITLLMLLSCAALPCHAGSGNTLLYVYSPDCAACRQFMAEAGSIYPKTQEATLMPMSAVTLEDWRSGRHELADCAIAPIEGTPTYVQIQECREIDRITGYSSDAMWWFSLKRMVDRIAVDHGPAQAVSTR